MLNAPLPLVTMSWSRLLLLLFVLSFILSSLVSLFFLDDFDDWGQEHQPLYIAHTQLPSLPHPSKPLHPSSPSPSLHPPSLGVFPPHPPSPHPLDSADNSSDPPAPDAALGVSLSHLLFASLDADDAAIDAMEARVRLARAAQHKTRPSPPSPYTSHPLALSNLTSHLHLTHLALTPYPPPPSPTHDGPAFRLLVIAPSPSSSRVEWYHRPAAPFFLPHPPALRHIVAEDWRPSAPPAEVEGRVSHSAVTPDLAWVALALTRLQPPFDYALALRLYGPGGGEMEVPLEGHQPVTALAWVGVGGGGNGTGEGKRSGARLMVARHLDTRRFRAFDVSEGEDGALVLEEGEDGPASGEGGGVGGGGVEGVGDVVSMLHYAEGDVDSVVLIDYDGRAQRQSPFGAALYALMPAAVVVASAQAQANDTGAAVVVKEVDEAGLAALVDAVTDEVQPPAVGTEEGVSVVSEEVKPSPAVDALDEALSQASSEALQAWQLRSVLPRYRSTGSMHPPSASSLITSSSPSSSYVVFASTPFLTTVDWTRHYNPIEIIHLHPSTAFTHIAVSDDGRVIALVDHQRDIILLQRAHTAPQAPRHGATEVKSQWEVALELILPTLLKRLPVLSASILAVPASGQSVEADVAAGEEDGVSAEGEATVAGLAVSAASERLYLCLLFEGGVLASFALDAPEEGEGRAGGSASDGLATDEAERRLLSGGGMAMTAGMDVVGEMLWLNWEFLIGQPPPAHSQPFLLPPSSFGRSSLTSLSVLCAFCRPRRHRLLRRLLAADEHHQQGAAADRGAVRGQRGPGVRTMPHTRGDALSTATLGVNRCSRRLARDGFSGRGREDPERDEWEQRCGAGAGDCWCFGLKGVAPAHLCSDEREEWMVVAPANSRAFA